MGYSMQQLDTQFHIPADRVADAFAAVRALFTPEGMAAHMQQWIGHYSWVEHDAALATTSLPEMLDEWGWTATLDESGAVTDIEFDGEKLGDEDALFGALAPYVQAGSYIEMAGEGGERWRWFFDGTTCAQQQAKFSYNRAGPLWDDLCAALAEARKPV